MKQPHRQNKGTSGVVSQATPEIPQPQKSYYEALGYHVIDLRAPIDEVVAFLKEHGNNEAMVDLVREHPNMTFLSHDNTTPDGKQSASSTISRGA